MLLTWSANLLNVTGDLNSLASVPKGIRIKPTIVFSSDYDVGSPAPNLRDRAYLQSQPRDG